MDTQGCTLVKYPYYIKRDSHSLYFSTYIIYVMFKGTKISKHGLSVSTVLEMEQTKGGGEYDREDIGMVLILYSKFMEILTVLLLTLTVT